VKYFIILLLFPALLSAKSIDVKANKMQLNTKTGVANFSGGVDANLQQGEEKWKMHADSMILKVDKANKPVSITASGNIKVVNKAKTITSKTAEYLFINKKLTLAGGVVLVDTGGELKQRLSGIVLVIYTDSQSVSLQ
jgi:lipopolysaccharide export system protein LptA